jgi:hypothetical protein
MVDNKIYFFLHWSGTPFFYGMKANIEKNTLYETI